MTEDPAKNDASQVRLRDKRKPGHCWQDNELYDCFQPVIGPLAVGVYVRITRECYGTAVKISLRELAALTGMSKSAVSRAMAVLELAGMILAKRGSAQRTPEYDLADLKDLAISRSAVFDAKRSSYVLPKEARERLRAEVVALEKRLQGTRVPVRDTEKKTVRDTSVPGEGQRCPSNAEKQLAQQISKKERIQDKDKNPIPSENPEGGVSNAAGSLVAANAERVMLGCGFTDAGVRKAIAEQLAAELARGCDSLDAPVQEMIEVWKEYQQCRRQNLLRFPPRERKFFSLGMWRGSSAWPFDREAMERARRL